jgi:hypothetical protein
VLLLLPSPARLVCLQVMWDVGLPPLLWSFPPSATFTSFLAPDCWACTLLLPSPALLVYLQFCEGFPSPASVLQALHPLCYMSFLLLLLITQFIFFFPWVGVGLTRVLCLSGPGLSVEYRVPLSSPCGPRLPKPSGLWCLAAARAPSWFLRFT